SEAGVSVAEFTTVPALRHVPSPETPRPLEDTGRPGVRAALVRAPSATTTMADRPGATRHREEAASVAAQRVVAVVGVAAAVAGVHNPRFFTSLTDRQIFSWRGVLCGERT